MHSPGGPYIPYYTFSTRTTWVAGLVPSEWLLAIVRPCCRDAWKYHNYSAWFSMFVASLDLGFQGTKVRIDPYHLGSYSLRQRPLGLQHCLYSGSGPGTKRHHCADRKTHHYMYIAINIYRSRSRCLCLAATTLSLGTRFEYETRETRCLHVILGCYIFWRGVPMVILTSFDPLRRVLKRIFLLVNIAHCSEPAVLVSKPSIQDISDGSDSDVQTFIKCGSSVSILSP